MTQKNSKQRCKVDTVGNDSIKDMFEAYNHETLEAFRSRCVSMIEQSSGRKEIKLTFISMIMKATSKDFMVAKVTNYVLAGQGLGV